MKEDIENKIDNYFREGLEDFNIIPPVEVWNNIAGNLPEKKSSRKVFLWIAVAASVSLFAAFSGWNYLQKISTSDKIESVSSIANNESAKPNQNNLNSKSGNAAPTKNKDIENEAESNSQSLTLQSSQSNKSELVQNKNARIGKEDKNENFVSSKPVVRDEIEDNNTFKNIAYSNKNTESHNSNKVSSINNTDNNTESINNDGIPSIASIDLKSFETPNVYGKINYGSLVVKIDTTPVYDNIYAYEDVAESKEKLNRWTIGGQLAPLYSYRNISEVNTPGLTKASMDNIEKAIVTYSSGVVVDFEASSRLSFQTGVYYMKMGQEIENVSNFTKQPSARAESHYDFAISSSSVVPAVVNSTGTIVANEANLYYNGSLNSENKTYAPGNLALSPADNETKKNIEQVFEFIEVPFLAKYKIIDRKINLHLLGGLSTHVLVNNKTKLVTEDNSTIHGKTSDIETMNYSSSVGFGVGYKLRKNILLSIEPTFKYYLNSFNSNDAVKLHPYAFGLYSGFSFKF